MLVRLGALGRTIAFDGFCRAQPQWRFVRFKETTWGGTSFVVERADALGDPRTADGRVEPGLLR